VYDALEEQRLAGRRQDLTHAPLAAAVVSDAAHHGASECRRARAALCRVPVDHEMVASVATRPPGAHRGLQHFTLTPRVEGCEPQSTGSPATSMGVVTRRRQARTGLVTSADETLPV
jgi:hypothetical protein